MSQFNLITKITHTLDREDGSQARIVATGTPGEGQKHVDVYVLRRNSPTEQWEYCSERPHPDYRSMPVEQYQREGRSKMLQTVTAGEILRAVSFIGQPLQVAQVQECGQ